MKFSANIFQSTIFRYALAGGTASLVDIILFNVFVYIGGAHYLLAVILSNTVSFFIRFLLQKKAFKVSSKTNIHYQFFLYTILFAVSVGLTALSMYILVDMIHIQKSISQIISILVIASMSFFVYRYIVFPDRPKDKMIKARRLLVIAQKVDIDDPVLGFFHGWLLKMASRFDSIIVICLEKGRSELPDNVKVLSLGKEERQSRLQYLIHFYWYILWEKKNYEAVFVHMNQQYVVLGALIWKFLRKSVYMWRNHVSGGLQTKIAVRLCDKVFCTSEFSYTARYKKTVIMPVGIDTDLFKRQTEVEFPRSILFLGRIAPIKKPDLLCDALLLMKSRNVDFTAYFYGNALPKDERFYEELKQKFINHSGIFFLPGIPNHDTVQAYNRYEVSVNLTPSGSYDKTIFEAMACETLVVASNKSLYGLIKEDSIFKEGDSADLALKLENILNIKEKDKKQRGKDSRKIVLEHHSLEKLMEKLSTYIVI